MKYWSFIILLTVLFSACKSNSQTNGFEDIKGEFSEESVNKIIENSPYPFSEKVVSNFKHYAYYENFGNSGICTQYKILKENEEGLNKKLKQYNHLKNNSISYKDSSYVYVYNEQGKNIEIPELSEEFDDLSYVKLNNSTEVDIYIIENGKLPNVFLEGGNKIYNYSIGIYNFKKHSTLVYWFLVY